MEPDVSQEDVSDLNHNDGLEEFLTLFDQQVQQRQGQDVINMIVRPEQPTDDTTVDNVGLMFDNKFLFQFSFFNFHMC